MWKVPGPRAKTVSDSASLAPRIFSWVSVAVWLAATKVTLSGTLPFLNGGSGWFWFCGISCVGSARRAISGGWTITSFSLIVTLTRVEPEGRCLLAWRDSPQPSSRTVAPMSPAIAAALALPRPTALNLTEGEGDNFGRNAIFTYGHGRARLRLAPQDRQADRAEGGGDGGAADRPDLLLARPQDLSGPRRSAQAQAPQVAVGL